MTNLNSNRLIDKHTVCPECGAPEINDMNCFEQLCAIGVWEFNDPELLAEHFLTVASYNLQHPAKFTGEALKALSAVFIDHLDNNLPVPEISKRIAQMSEGKKRVLRDESEQRPILRTWKMTIADVYIPNRPEGVAQRVREWAASVKKEL